jgi:hypothetical protein
MSGATAVYRTSTGGWDHGALGVFYIGCFPKSEYVMISRDDYVPIGSIDEGKKILSWDVEGGIAHYSTKVTNVNRYIVNEIICINGTLRVSSCHPLLAMRRTDKDLCLPQWIISHDIGVGDCLLTSDNQVIEVRSKKAFWYDKGIEVLSLETENGSPFVVSGCVVRADNANDDIGWADTPVYKHLLLSA